MLERLSATVLEIAKEHQNGRAEKKSAMADFTERWFRDSGLYALCEKYQLRFMEGFILEAFAEACRRIGEEPSFAALARLVREGVEW